MKLFIPIYSQEPEEGTERSKRKFLLFPRQCPKTGTYYIFNCVFHYKYTSYCSDPNNDWHLIEITEE